MCVISISFLACGMSASSKSPLSAFRVAYRLSESR
jgi:hypothetical protein